MKTSSLLFAALLFIINAASAQIKVPSKALDSLKTISPKDGVGKIPAQLALKDIDFDNWDFENGLPGWMREGNAFNSQPTVGANIKTERIFSDMSTIAKSVGGDYWKGMGINPGYNGDKWIGTFENNPNMQSFLQTQGDGPMGTLTSPEFVITKPLCYFRIGGGADPQRVYVELQVKQPDGTWQSVDKKASFRNSEMMYQEKFILGTLVGRTARIRIVDNSSSFWGHINVDDFRFVDKEIEGIELVDESGRKYFVDVNAAVWGVADTHAHPAHDDGFGNQLIAGKPTDPLQVAYSNQLCHQLHGAIGMSWLQKPFIMGGDAHEPGGWPDFIHFPKFTSKTHQQQHVEMLKRAFEGGLKLFCALAVNNMYVPSLGMGPGNNGLPFDDESVIVRQMEAIKKMVKENNDWMEIALSPTEARRIILQGKMAVVLGIEVDNLGNFKSPTFNWKDEGLFGKQNKPLVPLTPLNADELLERKLNDYWMAGIRQITPMHYISGLFGGAAIFRAELAAQQFTFNNNISVKSGIDKKIPYSLYSDYTSLLLLSNPPLMTKIGFEEKILTPYGPSRLSTINAQRITPVGVTLIKKMMDKGFLIDSEHMGYETKEDLFDLAVIKKYPIMSSHTDPLGLSFNWTGQPVAFEGTRQDKMRNFGTTNIRHIGSEFQLADAHFNRIKNSGGVVGIFMLPYYKKAYSGYWGSIPNNCAGSTKTWAQTYLYSLEKMEGKGVALCSDRGMTDFIAPRFGVHAGFTLKDEEMWYVKKEERERQRYAQTNGVRYDNPMLSFHPSWYEEASGVDNFFNTINYGGMVVGYEEEDVWKALAAVEANLSRDKVPDGRELTREHRIRNFYDGLTMGVLDNPIVKDIHYMQRAAMFCAKNGKLLNSLPGYNGWLWFDKENIEKIYVTIMKVLPVWNARNGNNEPIKRFRTANRWWDFNIDGMAHYGMMPDFFQDLRNIGLSPGQLTPLFNSAEDYIQMWEKTLKPKVQDKPEEKTDKADSLITADKGKVIDREISRTDSLITRPERPFPGTEAGFPTIKIGNQIWMAKNLAVTHYNDGTPIATNLSDKQWAETQTGAYSVYGDDSEKGKELGFLYNGYAAASGKLCPKGWRMPTDEDWQQLEAYIGMSKDELGRTGGRGSRADSLKGGDLWGESSFKRKESTYFNVLPAGIRKANGEYVSLSQYGSFWTMTPYENPYKKYFWNRDFYYNSNEIGRVYQEANNGYSCRCIKEN
jgi:uncharacterized protein (TIGR02145 family)